MEYLILIAAGLAVCSFLLALDIVIFGLNTLADKCEDWKRRNK